MAAFQYDVRYVKPEEARADLVRVWTNNLSVDGCADDKFAWIYRRAIEPPAGVFLLAVQDRDGDRDRSTIVGTAGLAIRNFFVDDMALRAGLLANLAVDREHRTAMPALRLVRSARGAALREFDLAYGFPDRSAQAVFLRCGYRKLGTLGRWARILQHAGYVRRVVPVARLARAAGAALDAANLAFLVGRAAPTLRRYRLEWLDDVDERLDHLWHAARRAYTLVGTRDAAFLRWRFLEQPGHRFRIAALARRDSGELRAYSVVEQVAATSHLRDLFGHPRDLGRLLDLLLPALAGGGATSASIGFFGSDVVTRTLASRGFLARESERAIVCDVAPTRADLAAIANDAQSWHLTDADEDT